MELLQRYYNWVDKNPQAPKFENLAEGRIRSLENCVLYQFWKLRDRAIRWLKSNNTAVFVAVFVLHLLILIYLTNYILKN